MFSAITEGVKIVSSSTVSCQNIEIIQVTLTATNMLDGADIRCVATDILNKRQYYDHSSGPLMILIPSTLKHFSLQ